MNFDREAWLKSLKPGMIVACNIGRYGKTHYQLLEIERILKAIIVTNVYRFQSSGGTYRFDSWHSISIEPVTDEITDAIHRQACLGLINKFDGDFHKLTTKELEKISHIIAKFHAEGKKNEN